MPTLEEIRDDEDIDNMDFDPEDFDPRNPFAKSNPIEGRNVLVPVEARPTSSGRSSGASSRSGSSIPEAEPSSSNSGEPRQPYAPKGLPTSTFLKSREDLEQFKSWQMLYPVYFDKNKSRQEGRRVSTKLATENPLAESIMAACKFLGVRVLFEADKTHPKDWSNPGRIRVNIKDGSSRTPVTNKRHLYTLIAEFLQNHPTTPDMPKKSAVYQQIVSQVGIEMARSIEPKPLAVPRGWKINSILPLSSRAVSGGEATNDMMEQMQNQLMPGLGAPAPPEIKPKKVKIRGGR